jgi:hypothetical protein
MELYLDAEALLRVADEHRDAYAAAQPFPHVVLDGLLPEEALDLALAAFPDPESNVWKEYENYHEVKLETQGEERLGADLSLLLYQFNSAPFLRFLERLTGIQGLIGDPYFTGGGLHQIVPGGKLGIHADFSRHDTLPLERRLNVLVFLNEDWLPEYGGNLELWNRDASACAATIAPLYNRMVVFTIDDWTYHGHPEPLTSPPGVTRKSIALYYFTVDRPDGQVKDGKESTLFVQRPDEVLPPDTPLARGRSYSGLKGDRMHPPTGRERTVRTVRRLTPPALYDAVVRARAKRR